MADTQRIVDNIRTFVHQACGEPLRALAAAYAAACQEANDRLRRCDELLRQGLRSEAIRCAEAEPNLLEVLARLDFPERAQWATFAAAYGLPAAPDLRLDLAEALNRACSELAEGKINPQLLDWARRQFSEDEIVTGLRELRDHGGQELAEFLAELEQEAARRE